MRSSFTLFVVLMLIILLASCAQQKIAEKKVENEIQTVVIRRNSTAGETARDFIRKSDKLTVDQKEQLLTLQEKTYTQNEFLTEEIEKTKLVLIQKVLDPNMNKREYEILKNKMVILEKKKMENRFKALSDARNIIEPRINLTGGMYLPIFF
jgi:PBP1b-binding outer membrane lipoprotein LpoB